MLTALVDHLWQCLWVTALAWAFVRALRRNGAAVRLGLWCAVAAKLLLPFSLLFACGAWLGFPLDHSADTVPERLVAASAWLAPLFAPANHAQVSSALLPGCAGLLLALSVAGSRLMVPLLRREYLAARNEAILEERDRPPGMGFIRAALLTATPLVIVCGTLLAGAISDQLWRHELLQENLQALRLAPVRISVATPGMGARSTVIADTRSVLIRNASVQEIVALVYGIGRYSVIANQMMMESESRHGYWMTSARYDVRVTGPVREPNYFDAFALREPVTRELVRHFGVELYLDGRCQVPCGRFDPVLRADAQ